ncbi:MAG: hypothetical protein J6T26_04830 [Firmicutes bacterium]|nr:hypothetical protein [Bacillota bacterium]
MLPYISNKSIMRPSAQVGFGGLNHNLSAGDGEIYWTTNMTSREYPLLKPRKRRNKGVQCNDFGAEDEIYYINGTKFDYGGWGTNYDKGDVTAGPKQFAFMGGKILIFPDKKYYDTRTDTFGSLIKQTPALCSATFSDGTYTGVPAEGNTMQLSYNGSAIFSEGDAVTVSGCVVHPENNLSAVIREVEGKTLRFYENTFNVLAVGFTAGEGGLPEGTYHFSYNGNWQFTSVLGCNEGNVLIWKGSFVRNEDTGEECAVTRGTGGAALEFAELPKDSGYVCFEPNVSVSTGMPDLDYICVNENRLWGCKGDTIYASKLGDPFNFNVFDGLASDSWQSDTEGKGDFTACVSYGGSPIFFKEDVIFKVQGDNAENFTWTPFARLGVKEGCSRSLAVVGETLFYVSPAGVCAYNGGAPRVISEPLGKNTKWNHAVGGSDDLRYFVSMTDNPDVDNSGIPFGPFSLFSYDTRYGAWFREDNSRALRFVYHKGQIRMLKYAPEELFGVHYLGHVENMDLPDDWTYSGNYDLPVSWEVEFADMTRFYETTDTGSQNKKGLLRLQLRCSLTANATLAAWVMYDSSGTWTPAGTLTGENLTGTEKKSYNLPLILRRCDHFRLKLTGTRECVIYSLTEVRYSGSHLQGGSVG